MFIDSNNNGILDPGEQSTTTDANGHFQFVNIPDGAIIMAKGGRDSLTDIENGTIAYRAYNSGTNPKDQGVDIILSPLTTLIAAVASGIANGGEVSSAALANAATIVATTLGLNIADSSTLLTSDPQQMMASGATAGQRAEGAAMLAADRQIAALITTIGSLISGAAATNTQTVTTSNLVTNSIADLIIERHNTSHTIDTTSVADIKTVLTTSIETANTEHVTTNLHASFAADITTLATLLANVNSNIETNTDLALTNDTNSQALIKSTMTVMNNIANNLLHLGDQAETERTSDISISGMLSGLTGTGISNYTDNANFIKDVETGAGIYNPPAQPVNNGGGGTSVNNGGGGTPVDNGGGGTPVDNGGGGSQNHAPVITSGATGTVVENAATSTVVYTVTATDPESDTLTYSLGGTDAAAFNIDATTGEVKLNASADYETKTSYSINVIATDNGAGALSDSHAVTINVTNDPSDDPPGNSAPSITSGATGTVVENAATSTVVYTVTATDPESDTLTYSLGGTDAAAFNIDATTGVVKLNASADYETKTSYNINVIATDNGAGALSDSHAVTINVTNDPTDDPSGMRLSINAGGAWVDTNTNGVKDGAEVYLASTVNATDTTVTFHVYDTPTAAPINVTGFGLDDRIVIHGDALANATYTNGGPKLAEFVAIGVMHQSHATHFGSGYAGYSKPDTGQFLVKVTGNNINLVSTPFGGGSVGNQSTVAHGALLHLTNPAATLATGNNMNTVVDFINPPDIHIVVERTGTYIDADADGVHDVGEVAVTGFQSGGNVNLQTHHAVIHFNDAPLHFLNLTGFGSDDKMEFDATALMGNHILYPNAIASALVEHKFGTLEPSNQRITYAFQGNQFHATFWQNTHVLTRFAGFDGVGFNGATDGGDPPNVRPISHMYPLIFRTISQPINGTNRGALAYWEDNDPNPLIYPQANFNNVFAWVNLPVGA